jgi:hypothetical protein
VVCGGLVATAGSFARAGGSVKLVGSFGRGGSTCEGACNPAGDGLAGGAVDTPVVGFEAGSIGIALVGSCDELESVMRR